MREKANRDLKKALAQIDFLLKNPQPEEKITIEDRKVHKKPPTINRKTKGLPRGVAKDFRTEIKNFKIQLKKVEARHGENSAEADTAKKFLTSLKDTYQQLSNVEIAEIGSLRYVNGAL